MAGYNLAFFAGIRATGVAVGTAVALRSGPLWAGVLQALLRRRWPAPTWWLGTGLAVAGAAAMAGLGDAEAVAADPSGLALCASAGLSHAIYTLLMKRVAASLPASTAALRAFGAAATIAVPIAGWTSALPTMLSWREAATVLYLGAFTTGIAYLLFGMALRRVSAATGVTLALFEPVMAYLLAAVVVGEAVGASAWSGLALVLAGVLVVARAELRAAPAMARAGVAA
jgi:DME family drug/metabolite transporter